MRFLLTKTALVGVLCLALGGVGGWLFHTVNPSLYKGGAVRQSGSPFTYISPLLACDVGSQEAFPEFASLKAQLTDLVNQKQSSGEAQHISIYLSSLRSARWFEINPSITYAPASLLKVFVMMAYYKEADDTDNPQLLSEIVVFEGSPNPGNDMPGEVIPHLVNGDTYTVKQVIEQMIEYSDNDALKTLVDNFDQKTLTVFQKIFSDTSLPSPVTQKEDALNFLTVDNYALVFRILYGSTYLSTRYSEEALALLAKAQYKGGIVAGVPSSLTVAHKFGVTTVPATATSSAVNELHDCGIVYYPNNHPYLLCIMTDGNDFAKLQQTLKDVSSTAYTWLNTYYSNLPSSIATSSPVVKQ